MREATANLMLRRVEVHQQELVLAVGGGERFAVGADAEGGALGAVHNLLERRDERRRRLRGRQRRPLQRAQQRHCGTTHAPGQHDTQHAPHHLHPKSGCDESGLRARVGVVVPAGRTCTPRLSTLRTSRMGTWNSPFGCGCTRCTRGPATPGTTALGGALGPSSCCSCRASAACMGGNRRR